MASKPNDVNLQMQKIADNAVSIAKDQFGVSLDFTEDSLGQLELLLQQADERYKQASSAENAPPIPIENTVRVWGSYLGEVIHRSLGGEWIIDEKAVFLQLGNRKLAPLIQVRSRITDGLLFNVQTFFQGLKAELQPPVTVEPAVQVQPAVEVQPEPSTLEKTKPQLAVEVQPDQSTLEKTKPQAPAIEEAELKTPKWEYMFIQWNNHTGANGVYVVSTNGGSERKVKGPVKEGKILEFLNYFGRAGWEVAGVVSTRRIAGFVTTWTLMRMKT
jgi:hypothetical protein